MRARAKISQGTGMRTVSTERNVPLIAPIVDSKKPSRMTSPAAENVHRIMLLMHRYGFGLGAARKHTGTTNIAIIKKFCTEQYQMDTTDLSRDQSCVPQLHVVECRISHEDAVKTADEIK
jgi:hypothetical protein